jgi:hypothetical protein
LRQSWQPRRPALLQHWLHPGHRSDSPPAVPADRRRFNDASKVDSKMKDSFWIRKWPRSRSRQSGPAQIRNDGANVADA